MKLVNLVGNTTLVKAFLAKITPVDGTKITKFTKLRMPAGWRDVSTVHGLELFNIELRLLFRVL